MRSAAYRVAPARSQLLGAALSRGQLTSRPAAHSCCRVQHAVRAHSVSMSRSRFVSSAWTVSESKMEGLRVMQDGTCENFSATRREIAKAFDMPARDVRQLVARGARVTVRPTYFLFSCPPFLAGCVSSEQALLITTESGIVTGNSATRETAAQVLQQSICHAIADSQQPFEHSVLEVVLREDMLRKQERFMRLSQLILRMLELREDPNISLRDRQLGLLRFGADRQAEAREQAMYLLLTLSNDLAELEDEVRRAERDLSQLLASDEDMASLYLSHRKAIGTGRAINEHSEVEYILETAVMQLQWLEDRVRRLQGSVTTHRALEDLKLRNERNRIMRLEIMLSMGSISLGVAAVIGGLFGMNLSSGLEEVTHGFWICAAGTCTLSSALLIMLMSGIRRFHRSQRINVMQTATLRRALGGLDHAYYALRRKGVLNDESPTSDGNLSREEARVVIEATKLPSMTVSSLLDLMDIDDDGMLTLKEMRASHGERNRPK